MLGYEIAIGNFCPGKFLPMKKREAHGGMTKLLERSSFLLQIKPNTTSKLLLPAFLVFKESQLLSEAFGEVHGVEL